jgi:proliferating cell nuclear antigen
MEAVIEDARLFKNCIDAIVSLVDEGSFVVSKTGLQLRTMDPSQIAMVDFSFPKQAFAKLEADEEQTLGLNLGDLSKILNRARAGEKLTLSLQEKESRLLLEFSGGAKRSFKLPLLDLSGTLPREPKIQFDASIKLKGRALKDILHDAGLLSSHVVLEAKDKQLVVEAHGDSGDLRTELVPSEDVKELKATNEARAMFPFEYLDNMTRACPDDAEAELSLKTNAPIRVAYAIGQAKLTYYLAPRVETA